MKHTFNSDFFVQNRQRLRERFGNHLIVLTANGLLQRNGDNTFAFRQDSNFWYLTGIDVADVVLVMDGGEEYLIVPPRDEVRSAFDGAVDEAALTQRSGVAEVMLEKAGWARLEKRVKRLKKIATPLAGEAYNDWHGCYVNPARGRLSERLKAANPKLETVDIREQLMRQRAIKQPVELAALQEAIDVTNQGIQAVTTAAALKQNHYEYEVEADLAREFKRRGGRGHAFTPIIASGERACTLHNLANDGRLPDNGLLLLDVGAEVDNYSADVSRTVAVGNPTARQRAVHEAVLAVQAFGFESLKAGRMPRDHELAIEQCMGEVLVELGVIKQPDKQAIRKYFPHATSHFLGLDTHDVGDYTAPLEPGMVLTCEPGIYIPEEGIGIRIEDDVLITDTGNIILSDKLKRTL